MQVREKSGQTLTEPITASDFRTFMGLTDTSQDTLIGTMITAGRKWFENHTGLSIISKVYEVEFDNGDDVDNWFELPFSPVTVLTSVEIDGTEIEYYSKGQKVMYIYPLGTISTSTSNNSLDVEFTAGAADDIAKQALYRIVADLYNHRYDNQGVTSSLLSWDTMQLVNQLKTFTF
jgi:uncharacterized phiE125 gp8 family phage protein